MPSVDAGNVQYVSKILMIMRNGTRLKFNSDCLVQYPQSFGKGHSSLVLFYGSALMIDIEILYRPWQMR